MILFSSAPLKSGSLEKDMSVKIAQAEVVNVVVKLIPNLIWIDQLLLSC